MVGVVWTAVSMVIFYYFSTFHFDVSYKWSFAVILRIDITVSLRPSESLYYVGLSPVFMWLLFLYCWEYAIAGFGFKLLQ